MKYEITKITDYFDAKFQSAFTAYFDEIGIEIRKDTDLWSMMNTTDGLHCRAVQNAEQILGFIMFQKESLKSSTGFFLENVGYIRELYVRKDFRKSGVGSILVCAAEEFFRVDSVYKLILTYENDAIGFYKKLGFTEDKSYKAKNGQNTAVKFIS